MAAVRLHNSLFTPTPPNANSLMSRSSLATGVTSSDLISSRQFERKPPETDEIPFQRGSRIRLYALVGISFAILAWIIYCTVRYFVALRIYSGDLLRSRYAAAMGSVSTFTCVIFTTNSLSTICAYTTHFRRSLRILLHSLTYFSSFLVICLASINLSLVILWRMPQHRPADCARSIEGRCNWDVDVIWSGTGGSCKAAKAMPFGAWLGAAIARFIVTSAFLVIYHLLVHTQLSALRSRETFRDALPPMNFATDAEHGNVAFQSSSTDDFRSHGRPEKPPTAESSGRPVAISQEVFHDDRYIPRPLSFTEAGQVLGLIERNEVDIGDGEESVSSTDSSPYAVERPQSPIPPSRSESPELFTTNEVHLRPPHGNRDPYIGMETRPQNPPPSSFHRPQFTSMFRSIFPHAPRDAQEGVDITSSALVGRREDERMHFLGSYISRMSTIESIASREVPTPLRSSSRSDNGGSPSSSYLDSRPLSNRARRDRDDEPELVALPET